MIDEWLDRDNYDSINACFIHKDYMPDFDLGQELMENFIDILYNEKDIKKLVSPLEDLANYFNINLPEGDPKIQVNDEELRVDKNDV